MLALSSYRPFTATHTQAHVLQALDALFRSTRLVIDGLHWTAPTLDMIAARLGVHKSTVCRAVEWLREQGFIAVRKSRWARSPRLYIRVLVRPKPASVQRERNVTDCAVQPVTLQAATCCYRKDNTGETREAAVSASAVAGAGDRAFSGEDSPDPSPKAPFPASPLKRMLRGAMSGAVDRLKGRQSGTPQPGNALTLAQTWNAALAAHGHPRFPVDTKTLAHIKNAVARFQAAGLSLPDELPKVILEWSFFAPPKAGKVPVPWAVIRASEAYFDLLRQRAAYAASGGTVTPALPTVQMPPQMPPQALSGAAQTPGHAAPPLHGGTLPEAPQAPSDAPCGPIPVSAPAAGVAYMPKKGGLMANWTWGKKTPVLETPAVLQTGHQQPSTPDPKDSKA